MNVYFPDFYYSTMGRAAEVSPNINKTTIGPNSQCLTTEISLTETVQEHSSFISSTPKHYKKIDNSRRTSVPATVMRRPKSRGLISEIVEIKSEDSAIAKNLIAEINKEDILLVNKKALQKSEEAAKKQKEVFDELARICAIDRNKREVRRLGVVDPSIFEQEEVISNNEADKVAASKAQQRNEKHRQNVEEAKKKSVAQQEKVQIYENIIKWQRSYSNEYKSISETLKANVHEKSLNDIIAPYIKTLQQDGPITETILKNARDMKLTQGDIKKADDVLKNIRNIHLAIKAEIKKAENATAINKKALEDARQKEALEEANNNKAIAEAAASEANNKTVSEENEKGKEETILDASSLADCFDLISLKRFTDYRNYLNEVKKALSPLLLDESLKKFRFNLQKAVTTPVNAISPVSGSHMMDKYKKLYGLLSGQRNDLPENPKQHPLGLLLCKDILAKLFVRQGDLTVSSKPDAAFALASIIVNLWVEFPDFGQLLLSYFLRACPYLGPIFLPQLEGQSNEDYYRTLGYLVVNGEVEKQDKFLKRMKGIMRLYAAILITKPRGGKPHPLGLSEAWRWLAAILNLEPRPDICAELLVELLQVAGNDLLIAYRGQFKKLLAYICQEYFPRLEKVTLSNSGGPLTRLELFLQEVVKEGRIPSPPERLPPNFW